jgi:hypothetical protein
LDGNLIEVLLVASPLQLLPDDILPLRVAVGQQQLIELFAIDSPYFLELIGEMLRKFSADLFPPGVFAVVREGLQQLFKQTVHIFDSRLGQFLLVGVD